MPTKAPNGTGPVSRRGKNAQRFGSSVVRPMMRRTRPLSRCSEICSTPSAGAWRCSLPKRSRPSCSTTWPSTNRHWSASWRSHPAGWLIPVTCASGSAARFPDVKILVCRWQPEGQARRNLRQVRDAGADWVATTILETRRQLASQLPLLAQIQRDHDLVPQEWRAGRVRTDSLNSDCSAPTVGSGGPDRRVADYRQP